MAIKQQAKSNNAPLGRYGFGGATVDYGTRLGWWERLVFPSATTDEPFTITNKYNKRPDLLAHDVYGRSTLMWLILQYNNILDINTEFVTDAVVILPSKNRVFSEMLNNRQQPISKT